MRLWTREQAQEIDRQTIESGFLSLDQLVRLAGARLAEAMQRKFPHQPPLVFLVGPGLNGADGWACASALVTKWKWSSNIQVLFVEKKPSPVWTQLREEFKKLSFASANSAPLFVDENSEASGPSVVKGSYLEGLLSHPLTTETVLVDGLFGTGLDRNLNPAWQRFLKELALLPQFKIAIDLPTGLDANTGGSRGQILKCDATLTLGAPKPGLFMMEGPATAGRITVLALPFPKSITQAVLKDRESLLGLFNKKLAQKIFPKVFHSSALMPVHKYDHGQTIVLAGSDAYPGAGWLVAQAALRSGAGFVKVLTSEEDSLRPNWWSQLPEALYENLEILITNWNQLSPKHQEQLAHSAWVIGPGCTDQGQIESALQFLAAQKIENVVIDASALIVFAQLVQAKSISVPSSWVLTPHAGEASAILQLMKTQRSAGEESKWTAAKIDSDRLAAGRMLTKMFGCSTVLKGFRTLITTKREGLVYQWICSSGNAGLAKAGSGDVLAGMLAGMLAQQNAHFVKAQLVNKGSSTNLPALLLATWLHGRVADDWLRSGRDFSSLSPSDLLERLPRIIAALRSQSQTQEVTPRKP